MSKTSKRWGISSLIGGVAVLSFAFMASSACAQSPLEYDASGRLVPATVPHMYRYAFRVQDTLENLAKNLESKGDSARAAAIRTMLRGRLRMTDAEFSLFEDSAVRFGVEDHEIGTRVSAATKADKLLHPHTGPLTAAGQQSIRSIYAESEEYLLKGFAQLHVSLAPDEAKALDASILQFYASGLTLPDAAHTALKAGPASRRSAAVGTPSIFDRNRTGANAQPKESPAPNPCYSCNLPAVNTQLLFSTDGKTVTAILSVTISEADEENGCWPNADAALEQNNSSIATAEEDSLGLTATAATAATPVVVGDSYTVGGDAQSCDQDDECQTALVASTGFLTGVPSITSASIVSGAAGASGTITLTGNDLGGPPGNTPTLTASGTGLTVNAGGPTTYNTSSSNTSQGTQSVTYSISNTADPGDITYQLQTVWGSTSTNFTIDCGTPSGIVITPSTWNAGTTYTITIGGAGFCPTSTVSVAVATGSVTLNSYTYVNPMTITASVTPLQTDPTEPATVTVTNPSTREAAVFVPASVSGEARSAPRPAVTPPPLPPDPPPPVLPPSIGGGSATGNAMVDTFVGKLYLVDPYPSPLSGATNMSQTTIISNLTNAAVRAGGIITDGTSTVIAVYVSPVGVPVTFTTAGGLTLASWNASFLNSAPVAGSGTLAPVTPTLINGQYYAFALVQAPKQSNSVSYSSANVAAGPSTSFAASQYLYIYPTPVIFVHGLWGNASSLKSVQSSLAGLAPWSSAASSYTALSTLCYSISLPFDAISDPAGASASSCTLSSQSSLNTQINAVLATLDNARVGPSGETGPIVGGRVDLVVHSMGGLAARHFSAQTSMYKTVRNRMQGEFRTVVTLDTPEVGSGLATFLLQPLTAAGTCSQASTGPCYVPPMMTGTPVTTRGLMWWYKCGSSATTTLATCLASGGQPLGPAGSGPGGYNISPCPSANGSGISPACGAVASLQPTSPNIASLPSAQIPNTTWLPIDSDWKDNGLQPYSLARSLLNTLISAMALAGNPTTTSALGSADNDVIVTTSSQSWNTATVQRAEYLGKAHFSLGWAGTLSNYLTVGTYTDTNVTTDANVSSCVGIILMTGVPTSCPGAYLTGTGSASGDSIKSPVHAEPLVSAPALGASRGAGQTTGGNAVELPGDGRSIFPETAADMAVRSKLPISRADQRLEVQVPTGDVPLGKPLTIPVQFAAGKLVSLSVTQSVKNNNILQHGILPVHVILANGVPVGVEIVPAQLGQVSVEISAQYSDNAVVSQVRDLRVVPSSSGLKQFSLMQGGHDVVLVLEAAEQDRQTALTPTVAYEALGSSISLDDATQIKLTVKQDDANPVIRLDSNGLVHALREGTAVIVGNFDGAIDEQTVHVYSREDAPAGFAKVLPQGSRK